MLAEPLPVIWMIKYPVTFIILVILFSCKSRTENLTGNDSKQFNTEITSTSDSVFVDPISIDEIKNLDFITTTSGVIPKSETEKLCSTDTNGFFGFYTLINRFTNKQIGELKVFTADEPTHWKKDTENEKFAAIKVLSNEIKVWNLTLIGLTKSELNQITKDRFHYLKGQTMYVDFNGFDGTFNFRSDTVNTFEIKRTCLKK
jgi:hypothetical protein